MEDTLFAQWETAFHATAKKDHYAILQDHLDWFEMTYDPVSLLKGTIQIVRACCSHYMVDGRSIEPFLPKQAYDPQDVPDMTYSFTFILGGDVPARILLATKP